MITEHGGRDGPGRARPAAAVLTERIAAALVSRDPGWRLPRSMDLARRYNASLAEIDVAVRELTERHILRRLPDGRLYRASPAEYLLTLEGLGDLGSHIDPMGAAISCASRHVSWRRPPREIGRLLGLPPAGQVTVVRSVWTADGKPAAVATTYLPGHTDAAAAAPGEPGASSLESALAGPPAASAPAHAVALHVEVQPPAQSAARTLRLAPGVPALTVTVGFGDPSPGSLAALTAAVLRSDLFRITVQCPAPGSPDARTCRGSGAPARAAEDGDP